jgi:hypothetical protein
MSLPCSSATAFLCYGLFAVYIGKAFFPSTDSSLSLLLSLAPDATTGALRLRVQISPFLPMIAFGFVLLASSTIGSYVLDYMTSYALNTLHLPANVSFAIAITPIIVALTEALPKAIRSGVVATTYAFAISVFGGSTQVVITWLSQRTGNPLAPAWYWMGALLLGLTAALLMPETAPVKMTTRTTSAYALQI